MFDRLPRPALGFSPAASWDCQSLEEQLINRGGAESGPVATTYLGAGLSVQVATCHAIGRGASEDIVLVLPDARGSEQAIPEIQLGFGKARIAGDDLLRNAKRGVDEIDNFA